MVARARDQSLIPVYTLLPIFFYDILLSIDLIFPPSSLENPTMLYFPEIIVFKTQNTRIYFFHFLPLTTKTQNTPSYFHVNDKFPLNLLPLNSLLL